MASSGSGLKVQRRRSSAAVTGAVCARGAAEREFEDGGLGRGGYRLGFGRKDLREGALEGVAAVGEGGDYDGDAAAVILR